MTENLEKTLWATADKLRNDMDAAEYKHVVLGLTFLKYISDSFEELYNKLKKDKHSDPEDKDEYLAEKVFYVPPSARWQYLQHQRARLPTIGRDLDDAMDAIEKDNPSPKDVLPKDHARPAADKRRLIQAVPGQFAETDWFNERIMVIRYRGNYCRTKPNHLAINFHQNQ